MAESKESPEELARRFKELADAFDRQLQHLTPEERENLLAEILKKS